MCRMEKLCVKDVCVYIYTMKCLHAWNGKVRYVGCRGGKMMESMSAHAPVLKRVRAVQFFFKVWSGKLPC